MPGLPGSDALAQIRREIERTAFRTRNGLKHFAGVDHVRTGQTPRDTVWARDNVRLHRYRRPDDVTRTGTPVLIVMSLVSRPYVFDLRPGNSAVARLLAGGRDVYLLDWGVPGPVDAHNGLDTYCDDYLPHAIDAVRRTSGTRQVQLFAYCLGGVLSLLSLAGNPDLPVRGVTLLAVPVDLSGLGMLANVLRSGRLDPVDLLDETGNVPASTILAAFRGREPTGDVTTYLNLWNSLDDPERLAAHQAFVGWSSDHIPFPGQTFLEITGQFLDQRAMLQGRVTVGGREVVLADVDAPVLSITGERDDLIPPVATEAMTHVLTGTRCEELSFPAGHASLLVGRRAQEQILPAVLSWMDRVDRGEAR